jgi:hypothetical protein
VLLYFLPYQLVAERPVCRGAVFDSPSLGCGWQEMIRVDPR